MSTVPPARSTRVGAEVSIVIALDSQGNQVKRSFGSIEKGQSIIKSDRFAVRQTDGTTPVSERVGGLGSPASIGAGGKRGLNSKSDRHSPQFPIDSYLLKVAALIRRQPLPGDSQKNELKRLPFSC